MKNTSAIHVVLQMGGSTAEHYFHSFGKSGDAELFIQSAEAASYECYGPEQINIPELDALILSVRQLLRQLPTDSSCNWPAVNEVKHCLAAVENSLLGN